jgi:hypothetical protein
MMFRALHEHVRGRMQACNPVTGEARVFDVVPAFDNQNLGEVFGLNEAWADYFRACGDWKVEPDATKRAGSDDGGGAPAGGRGAPPPESVEGGVGAPGEATDAPPASGGEEAEGGDAEAGARGRSGARRGR